VTCRDFVEFLMEYSSGELAGSECAEFEAHLVECPECVAYLETYKKTIDLVKTAYADPHHRVPAEVPERLVQAVLAARPKGA
jgi:anti-sigma factor RsiW